MILGTAWPVMDAGAQILMNVTKARTAAITLVQTQLARTHALAKQAIA